MTMIWTPDEIDCTGTIRALNLPPLSARLVGEAAAEIGDPAIRAFLVAVLLDHEPHRIRSLADRRETGYRMAGGRALRAAVMLRALDLMSGAVSQDSHERLLAAAILGNLVHTGPIHDVTVRRAWLKRVAENEAAHLAEWGLSRARASALIDLAIMATGVHSDAFSHWMPASTVEHDMVRACRAADLARPLDPLILADPAPLPAWMDPSLARSEAGRLLRADLAMDHVLQRIPGRFRIEIAPASQVPAM